VELTRVRLDDMDAVIAAGLAEIAAMTDADNCQLLAL
jgi:hypothetical protein